MHLSKVDRIRSVKGRTDILYNFGYLSLFELEEEEKLSVTGSLNRCIKAVLFLVPGGTYFHLEPSHAVHARESKY